LIITAITSTAVIGKDRASTALSPSGISNALDARTAVPALQVARPSAHPTVQRQVELNMAAAAFKAAHRPAGSPRVRADLGDLGRQVSENGGPFPGSGET